MLNQKLSRKFEKRVNLQVTLMQNCAKKEITEKKAYLYYKLVVLLRLYYTCYIEGKVKCTLVQALRLCTGCTAYRGSRGIALPFHDHGTRRG
jgi:hypothetical protein